jgi:hypothetical protein
MAPSSSIEFPQRFKDVKEELTSNASEIAIPPSLQIELLLRFKNVKEELTFNESAIAMAPSCLIELKSRCKDVKEQLTFNASAIAGVLQNQNRTCQNCNAEISSLSCFLTRRQKHLYCQSNHCA